MSNKQPGVKPVSDKTTFSTNLRRTALSLAVAAALPAAMAMPMTAFAQDADDQVIEEIVRRVIEVASETQC